MPGAPAATHAPTASMTLGVRPPRELRSVATLLTLTLRRIMEGFRLQASGSRPPRGIPFFAQPPDLRRSPGLVPRVPHQQPPLPGGRGCAATEDGPAGRA